jgi:hypothetical protein
MQKQPQPFALQTLHMLDAALAMLMVRISLIGSRCNSPCQLRQKLPAACCCISAAHADLLLQETQ